MDQTSLLRGRGALSVHGVIYALMSTLCAREISPTRELRTQGRDDAATRAHPQSRITGVLRHSTRSDTGEQIHDDSINGQVYTSRSSTCSLYHPLLNQHLNQQPSRQLTLSLYLSLRHWVGAAAAGAGAAGASRFPAVKLVQTFPLHNTSQQKRSNEAKGSWISLISVLSHVLQSALSFLYPYRMILEFEFFPAETAKLSCLYLLGLLPHPRLCEGNTNNVSAVDLIQPLFHLPDLCVRCDTPAQLGLGVGERVQNRAGDSEFRQF
jgi:hypothetical protein